jgi:hypothetical protein
VYQVTGVFQVTCHHCTRCLNDWCKTGASYNQFLSSMTILRCILTLIMCASAFRAASIVWLGSHVCSVIGITKLHMITGYNSRCASTCRIFDFIRSRLAPSVLPSSRRLINPGSIQSRNEKGTLKTRAWRGQSSNCWVSRC